MADPGNGLAMVKPRLLCQTSVSMFAFFIGLVVSTAIAYLGLRRGSLTPQGAIYATVCGTLVLGLGGVGPGVALLAFYLSSTALSRYRQEEKAQSAGEILEKAGARDGLQVVANGGVAALCSIGYVVSGWEGFACAAVGSLAAATADTWATEIGMLSPERPRRLPDFQEVPPGTSGAVSTLGLCAQVAGSILIAALAAFHLGPVAFLIITPAGILGGLLDSVLGATLQERRACPRCVVATEQAIHTCGHDTLCTAGIEGLNNDMVNLVCTAVGAIWAMVLYLVLGG